MILYGSQTWWYKFSCHYLKIQIFITSFYLKFLGVVKRYTLTNRTTNANIRQENTIFKFETEIIDYETTGSLCGKNASWNRVEIQTQSRRSNGRKRTRSLPVRVVQSNFKVKMIMMIINKLSHLSAQ